MFGLGWAGREWHPSWEASTWGSQAAREDRAECVLTASAVPLHSVLFLLLNTQENNNKLVTNIFMQCNIFVMHFKYFI